ncbi:PAP2 superfamily protein [Clostridium tepidiprofundi DSM 19306]|uniref:PAP2 superfamily protein n=1 Tax=Clostridium tepidiprofundi DSM 19306 TaxID=1121338 RepID=A0A151AYZ0_9CLOT|nr:phosphatase PAP2 family protein [Clostridium tepidiprofundi]KYH32856.1 PAP2 superfamily protein [Clostridium tepidiprofundi DSM 19306]
MKISTAFMKKNKHFFYLLLFVPLLLWFYACEKSMQPKYNMHCVLDNYIPFIKYFIIPYLLWFPYMGFAFLYLGLKDKKSYLKLLLFLISGMSISYIIFIAFPTGQDLRREIEGKDVFLSLVTFIRNIDPPTNVCPSIHVLNSIGVHTVIANSDNTSRRVKLFSLINMILICASTVFIKQHSILDVIAGIGIALVLSIMIYVLPNLYLSKNGIKHLKENNKSKMRRIFCLRQGDRFR